MKQALLVLVFSLNATAATPSEVGNFEGIVMTGAVVHHPVAINGGKLSSCVTSRNRNDQEIHTCAVEGASATTAMTDGEPELITFKKVVVLSAPPEMTHYYFSGSRTVQLGGREIVQAVSMTVNVTLKDKSRVWGFIELRETGVRSAFEVLRK